MSKKRNRRETFSDWLTRRHQLILRNEENFEEKTTFTYNNYKVIVIGFFTFVIIFLIGMYLERYYISKWNNYDGYDNQYKRDVTRLSTELDSLEHAVHTKDKYIEAIKLILEGGNPDDAFKTDTIKDKLTVASVDSAVLKSDIDKKIREEFEKSDNIESEARGQLSETLLFTPVESYAISKKYIPRERHYGVDLLTKSDQIVSTVADGVVIFSEWTEEGGNILIVQHDKNLISVYKHNSVLLKKVGENVEAGDAVAIVGNSGEQTSGHHLHFELWLEGESIDPESVISF